MPFVVAQSDYMYTVCYKIYMRLLLNHKIFMSSYSVVLLGTSCSTQVVAEI